MSNFHPGAELTTITSKQGDLVSIRWVDWTDLHQLHTYVNALSQEDTFVSVSGEEITKTEEADFLASTMKECELNNAVFLVAEDEGKIVGLSGINRDTSTRKRAHHVGIFGISLAPEYRNKGIGFEFATTVIKLAEEHINNLRIVSLSVFETNQRAESLYVKLGFKSAGMIPGGIQYKNTFIGHKYMYLPLKEES